MSAPSNLSIRSARREYRLRFEEAIRTFRVVCEITKLNNESASSLLSRLPVEMSRRVVRYYTGNVETAAGLLELAHPLRPPPAEQFEIFVRKRPLWESERAQGEYDALTIDEAANRCVVHDGKAARDMSTYTLHREFALDGVYSEHAGEGELFTRVVDPLYDRARCGGCASLITFGQTGTGKTFTTNETQRYLARRLFDGSGMKEELEVSVEIFELREKKAYDLLNERKLVRLVTGGAEESVHVLGGTKVVAVSSCTLLEAIATAHALRSVAATERNAQSSRSHCVTRLRIAHADGQTGTLTLVDLAGSERNYETTQHDRSATRESADINMSLQTLKECFRATINKDVDLETLVEVDQDDVEWTRAVPKGYKAAVARAQAAALRAQEEGADGESVYNGLAFDPAKPAALMNFAMGKEASNARSLHMPYRRHQLTLLLKDCFVNPEHRTAVLACCSPSATDVEHTVRTLNQVCQMRGADHQVSRQVRVECTRTDAETAANQAFRKWSAQRVQEWFATLEDDLACAAVLLPSTCDGRELLQRWPVARLAHTCLDGSTERAIRLYDAIRLESTRVDGVLAEKRERVRGLAGRAHDKYGPSAKSKEQASANDAESKPELHSTDAQENVQLN